jgi:hypothetical protein
MMTPVQAELLDVSILRVLDLNAGRNFGLNATSIQNLVSQFGFQNESTDTINARLAYMADAEIAFVAPVDKGQFNPANASWKITARGINELRRRGH